MAARKSKRNPARVAEEKDEAEIAALQRATITHVGMAALAVQDFCREGMRVLKRYDDFAALDDERRAKRLQIDIEAEARKAKGDAFIEEVTATFRKALPQMLRTMGLDPDGKPLGHDDDPKPPGTVLDLFPGGVVVGPPEAIGVIGVAPGAVANPGPALADSVAAGIIGAESEEDDPLADD